MYKHILIPTDGSELAGKAVNHGIALAKRLNVPVTVVTVTESWSALELGRMARQGNLNPVNQFEEMATAAATRRAAFGPARRPSGSGSSSSKRPSNISSWEDFGSFDISNSP